ncbi:hypothetical protein CC86DRAFT_406850 [Ophiobolus disseminans]|uniref:C2H2-type domain-containing protein n=1 Tax=Ophiobolus disseminans TaxID=1469910 RepID=A0A6A6ZYH7_9PLEO|nr:hypothetical protein CC86DRAFT_406850 [Ophiobolus disseminans]
MSYMPDAAEGDADPAHANDVPGAWRPCFSETDVGFHRQMRTPPPPDHTFSPVTLTSQTAAGYVFERLSYQPWAVECSRFAENDPASQSFEINDSTVYYGGSISLRNLEYEHAATGEAISAESGHDPISPAFEDEGYLPTGGSISLRSIGNEDAETEEGTNAKSADVSSVPVRSDPDVLGCGYCSLEFNGKYRRGNMQRHMRLKHTGNTAKTYPCEVHTCDMTFTRRDARLKHHRKRHPEIPHTPFVPRSHIQGENFSKRFHGDVIIRDRDGDDSIAPSTASSNSTFAHEVWDNDAYNQTVSNPTDRPIEPPHSSLAPATDHSARAPGPVTPSRSFEHVEVARADQYTCPSCRRSFERKADCLRHEQMHRVRKSPCAVPSCSTSFYRKDKWRDHFRREHSHLLCATGCCSDVVDNADQFVDHIWDAHMHASAAAPLLFSEMPDTTDDAISSSMHHPIVRTDDESISNPQSGRCICSTCGKSFPYGKDLRRHEIVHAKQGEKPLFLCTHCPRSFSRKDNLQRHMRREHASAAIRDYVGQVGQERR